MSKPYSQPGEKGTDTNQASEDIVDSILSTLGIVDRKSGNRPDQIQVVKQIIRTEKLKLLAEVRERVIGENLPPDVATDSGIDYSFQQLAINMGKAGQRTKLTELEAEL